MDLAKWLAARLRLAALAAADAFEGFPADDLRSFLGFWIDDDLVGAVDLEVGEDAVLEDEPPGAPPLAVVYPLVQDAGDAGADDIVQLDGVAVFAVEEGGGVEGGGEGAGSGEGGEQGAGGVVALAGGWGGLVVAGWATGVRSERSRHFKREGIRRRCCSTSHWNTEREKREEEEDVVREGSLNLCGAEEYRME